MSHDTTFPPPPPSDPEISPEDLARLLASSGAASLPGATLGGMPARGSLRRKLLVLSLVAAVGVGASFMSCVGQSFSYRQARALEGIEKQLEGIQAGCSARGAFPAPADTRP